MSSATTAGFASHPDFNHMQRGLARVNSEMTILDEEQLPEPAGT